MRGDPYGTAPMFELAEPERPPAPKRKPATSIKPVWSKYRPAKPVRCEHCVLVLHENDGHGPPSRQARHKRKAGGETTVLCGPHAQAQRALDKLPPLKGIDQ